MSVCLPGHEPKLGQILIKSASFTETFWQILVMFENGDKNKNFTCILLRTTSVTQ
jgi:hypothetical protein